MFKIGMNDTCNDMNLFFKIARVTRSSCMLLLIHAVYVNSSIVDEGALIKLVPCKIEVQILSTRFHYNNLGSLKLLLESNHLNIVICGLYIIRGAFTNAMDEFM